MTGMTDKRLDCKHKFIDSKNCLKCGAPQWCLEEIDRLKESVKRRETSLRRLEGEGLKARELLRDIDAKRTLYEKDPTHDRIRAFLDGEKGGSSG